jgi:hypothetical protein
MSLEIILIILIGVTALAVTIWFIVRQFRANKACDFCPYSDICEKEEDKPQK